MFKILQYELSLTFSQEIEMPKGAEILCVQMYEGVPHMWVKADPDASLVARKFLAFGTYNTLHGPLKYIATYQVNYHVINLFEDYS